jgi:hypothetical protein
MGDLVLPLVILGLLALGLLGFRAWYNGRP